MTATKAFACQINSLVRNNSAYPKYEMTFCSKLICWLKSFGRLSDFLKLYSAKEEELQDMDNYSKLHLAILWSSCIIMKIMAWIM
jgi:hypothetical protein